MYLADRHSTIYEMVNRILLANADIKNSHFERACFDNVTFRNVTFDNDCFYKAVFEDVRFVDCTFKDCDFTQSRGYNVTFENCIQQNSDLSKMKMLQDEAENESETDINDKLKLDDEECEIE